MTLDLAPQTPTELPDNRGYEPAEPSFRQLGDPCCEWCNKFFKRRPKGGDRAHFCRDACRSAVRRCTDRKEVRRRREKARQLMGLATADENNRESREKAQELALRYLATHPVAIISDIRDFAIEEGVELEWHKPWTANVFRSPWFEFTGKRRAAHHSRSNARKVNEYRLTDAGRGALSELRSRS